jgi:putative endonuclease
MTPFLKENGRRQDGAPMGKQTGICYTYIIQCSDGTLYTGWTNDIEKRVLTHNAGKGAKYTRSRTPVKLVYLEQADTKKRAMQREAQIKRLSRYEKEQLIRSSTNGSTV